MSWRLYIVALGILTAVTAVFLLVVLAEDPAAPSAQPGETAEIASEPAPRLRARGGRATIEPITTVQKPLPDEPISESKSSAATEDRAQRAAAARVKDDVGTDAGSQGAEPEPSKWSDPRNQEVLGAKAWMAEVPDAENERIDEVFENARAARFDPRLSMRDRRSSIETARAIVDECFAALKERNPQARGRLIVTWNASATKGSGRIEDPQIATNYKLDDPQFEACILDGLDGLRFEAGDGETRRVEYPFFYED